MTTYLGGHMVLGPPVRGPVGQLVLPQGDLRRQKLKASVLPIAHTQFIYKKHVMFFGTFKVIIESLSICHLAARRNFYQPALVCMYQDYAIMEVWPPFMT